MNAQTIEKKDKKNVNDLKLLPMKNEVKTATVEQKEEILKSIEKFKPEPILSAEQRIERVKQFEALSVRYGALKEKDNELKTFHADNDKTSAKIIFKNAQGFEFTIQNSNVIEKLIEAGKQELNILLKEAENEVVTFEI